MSDNKHLYVLWTNANSITAENMVFMYATNSLFHGWWEEVTLIIWGAPTKLVAENEHIQDRKDKNHRHNTRGTPSQWNLKNR